MSSIYEPSDDSYFLSEILKKIIKNKNIKVLEIGSGSGIQAKTLINIGVNPVKIVLTDINPEAIHYLNFNFNKSKIIMSNLFSNIIDKYDFIIFNPPYLPEDKLEPEDSKLATTSGKTGSKIINKFLRQAKKYLRKGGKIILLTSSLTKHINWLDYRKKLLGKKKLFFEKLYAWELTI